MTVREYETAPARESPDRRGRAPRRVRLMGAVSPEARPLRRKRHAYASTSLFSSMIRKNTSVGGRLFPASQRSRSSVVTLRIRAICLSP